MLRTIIRLTLPQYYEQYSVDPSKTLSFYPARNSNAS